MKIIIFGHRGQIGSSLVSLLAASHDLVIPDIDIIDYKKLSQNIENANPDAIINAAAYTRVDDAEKNPDLAFQVNVNAPQLMAEYAFKKNIPLVHYSTDYVFDGSGDVPWTENDIPAPINVYGHSKLAGDIAIQKSKCRHLIFRTSWVYGSSHKCFPKRIYELARTHKKIEIVDDQIGTPTYADFIASCTVQCLEKIKSDASICGLYHLTHEGHTSWYDFAKLIIQETKLSNQCSVNPVSSENYKSIARRPLNSRLDTSKFQSTFKINQLDWHSKAIEYIHTHLREKHD